jgi:hypothetical protein
MLDVDTFLTTLYVTVDDFCHSHPPIKRPGPQPSLSESEIITLTIFAQWSRFASERDFYRYAQTNLLEAFPTLQPEDEPRLRILVGDDGGCDLHGDDPTDAQKASQGRLMRASQTPS